MKQDDLKKQLPIPSEKVKLQKPIGKRLFRLLSFLVCTAILVAAFAVSGIWTSFGAPVKTFFEGIFRRERVTEQKPENAGDEPSSSAPETSENPPEEGQNAIPVVAKTLYEPKPEESSAGEVPILFETPPAVLIYCANPAEAYLEKEAQIPEDGAGEATFSADPQRSISTVAQKLCDVLTEHGISVIFQEQAAESGYLGSSERSADLIRKALCEHPQISLVISVGRDSLFDGEGNYIKTVTGDADDPTAQVLAIVGSGESGASCPAWQENLALARALQTEAERETPGIFRGIRVKSTPQNQQYAKLSLSLLIGSGGNFAEEAERSAEKIGASLSALFLAS